MDYDKLIEELKVLKKFHTADKGKEETVFYRGKDNPNGVLKVNDDVFNLENINLLSLSRKYGVLIHYDTPKGRKLYPYEHNNIYDVSVRLR